MENRVMILFFVILALSFLFMGFSFAFFRFVFYYNIEEEKKQVCFRKYQGNRIAFL